ncbi:MAG: hypothetical protein ACRD2L_25695, partial [Terriglobia bacterium]
LLGRTSLPHTSARLVLEDLEALGLIEVEHNNVIENTMKMKPEAAELWFQAFGSSVAIPTGPKLVSDATLTTTVLH